MRGETQRVQVVAFVVCETGVRGGVGVIGSGGGGEVIEGDAEAGIDGGADAGTGSNSVCGLVAMLES